MLITALVVRVYLVCIRMLVGRSARLELTVGLEEEVLWSVLIVLVLVLVVRTRRRSVCHVSMDTLFMLIHVSRTVLQASMVIPQTGSVTNASSPA